MATIKDVARASGVSTATVSAVINDSAYVSPALRTRVLAAVRELGYAPSLTARNLRSGRSQLVALVVADLANRRIGTITGPLQLSTGRGRLDGMLAAMKARDLAPEPQHVRSGEFREDAAYSVARNLLQQPHPPTALYVANGVMALGVMRA